MSPQPGISLGDSSNAFYFHGSSVLTSSGRSGLHRSSDRGDEWRRSMRGLVDAATGVEPLAGVQCQAASAPATVYVATNAGNNRLLVDRIYRSDDFGKTWRPLAGLGSAAFTLDCAVDPSDPDTLFALGFDRNTFQNLLFKSTDGGQHFASVGSGLELTDAGSAVRVSPFDRNTVYLMDGGTFDGVYVSTDGGLNFTRSPSSPALPFSLFFHPTEPATLFVSTASVLFRSTDGGATYTSPAGLTPQAGSVAFDPRDPRTNYVAGGTDGLFVSHDDGATYQRLPGPASNQLGHLGVNAVALPPAARGGGEDGGGQTPIYVSTSYGPLRSDDGGQTFAVKDNGYRGAVVNDLAFDASGKLLVGVFHTLQLFRGTRAGEPEPYTAPGATILPGGETITIAASAADANLMIVALPFDGGVFRTEDGGAAWTRSTGIHFVNNYGRMTFAPSDSSRVYHVNRSGGPARGFYRSTDGGRTFAQTLRQNLGSVAVDPSDANTVYVGTFDLQRGLFKSTDGGITFASVTLTPAQRGDFGTIAVDPSHTQTVYAGRRQGGLLRSDDGGASWAFLSGLPGGEVLGVALDPQEPARVFAWIQEEGLFRSDDRGATWRAADTGEAKRRSGVVFGRGKLVADPKVSGRVYIGNSGVVQIDTE